MQNLHERAHGNTSLGTQIGPGMPDTTHNDTRRRAGRSKWAGSGKG